MKNFPHLRLQFAHDQNWMPPKQSMSMNNIKLRFSSATSCSYLPLENNIIASFIQSQIMVFSHHQPPKFSVYNHKKSLINQDTKIWTLQHQVSPDTFTTWSSKITTVPPSNLTIKICSPNQRSTVDQFIPSLNLPNVTIHRRTSSSVWITLLSHQASHRIINNKITKKAGHKPKLAKHNQNSQTNMKLNQNQNQKVIIQQQDAPI